MDANSHHRPLLVVTVALQRGVATTAAVGPAQVGHLHGLICDGDLYYRIYGVCIGILACRGLSLVSSPLHAMKSQTPNLVFRCSEFGGVTDWYQSSWL
ncbi:hypothetical protein Tco_0655927 [Tanacetum coccineum]|uniref:Secreted protein n=1 Tax=Tanacetum coccineum TaxID=301880 RepID=A0ABQ4X7T7_9ASTR